MHPGFRVLFDTTAMAAAAARAAGALSPQLRWSPRAGHLWRAGSWTLRLVGITDVPSLASEGNRRPLWDLPGGVMWGPTRRAYPCSRCIQPVKRLLGHLHIEEVLH